MCQALLLVSTICKFSGFFISVEIKYVASGITALESDIESHDNSLVAILPFFSEDQLCIIVI